MKSSSARVMRSKANRELRYISILKNVLGGGELSAEDAVFLNKQEERLHDILSRTEDI